MKKLFMAVVAALFFISVANSQNVLKLSGRVSDKNRFALPGKSVRLLPVKKGTVSDANSNDHFSELKAGIFILHVSFIGYKTFTDTIEINASQKISIQLQSSVTTLDEVIVEDNYAETQKRKDSRNVEVVNDRFV